jgi:hypothetical protein
MNSKSFWPRMIRHVAILRFSTVLGITPRDLLPDNWVRACGQVCDEYAAGRRGNGYDLCENGGTSDCVFNNATLSQHCQNLYWSVMEDDDDTYGLIYETDVSSLTDEERNNPLTCDRASDIVRDIVRGQETVNEHSMGIWNMALQMFVNSPPIRRLLNNTYPPESIWPLLADFANTGVSRPIRDRLNDVDTASLTGAFVRLVAVTNTVDSFAANLSQRMPCDNCNTDFNNACFRFVPIINIETRDLVDELRSLLSDVVTESNDCPYCQSISFVNTTRYTLNSVSEIMGFRIFHMGPGNLSLPPFLNLTDIIGENSFPNPIYRLFGFTTENRATLRFDDDWFVSEHGSSFSLTNPVVDSVVSNSFDLFLYQQVQ